MTRTRAVGWLTLMWCASAGLATAQPRDLAVVLSAEQDELLADKLAELIREPFERVRAPDLTPPSAAEVCRTGARVELHFDSARHSVRLLRCSDATVLARGLDPEAARQSPYLGAFVAAELLSINRELEAVQARSEATAAAPAVEPLQPAAASGGPVASAPLGLAAASGGPAAPTEPPVYRVLLRAGAELTLWGAPFERAVRPSLGVGLALAPRALPVVVFAELRAGLFARASVTRDAEHLKLERHELQLHAGVTFPLGPIWMSGFLLARGSLTSADYNADVTTSSNHLRSGVGAGLAAEMPLTQSFSVYTELTLDVSTSRSDYRVANVSWVRDPSSLFWVGLGVLWRLSS